MGFPNPGQQAAQQAAQAAQRAAQAAQQAGRQAAQQGMQVQQASLHQAMHKRQGRSRPKRASCAGVFFVVLVIAFLALVAIFLFNLN